MDTSNSPKLSFLKRGKYWPWIIVGMLVFHASVILGTIAYVSAQHDLYVEPDYYAKAIDWDNQRAIKEAVDTMGWSVDLHVEESASIDKDQPGSTSSRRVEVTIHDANEDPITRALVEIEAYHPAHASDRMNTVLLANPDIQGHYTSSVPMDIPGFWQINIAIRHQGIEAAVTKEIEIQ